VQQVVRSPLRRVPPAVFEHRGDGVDGHALFVSGLSKRAFKSERFKRGCPPLLADGNRPARRVKEQSTAAHRCREERKHTPIELTPLAWPVSVCLRRCCCSALAHLSWPLPLPKRLPCESDAVQPERAERR
jgi:hypothetical protein